MELEKVYSESRETLLNLDCRDDTESIEKTAAQLKEISYQPMFLIEVEGFTRFTREDALSTLDELYNYDEEKIGSLPAAANQQPVEVKATIMRTFVKEFTLLEKLRAGLPEAWEEINELYEDD